MVTTREQRRRDRFAQAQRDHLDKIVEMWRDDTPDEYHGYDIDNDLFQDHWSGRLKRGQVLRLKKYLRSPTRFLILRGTSGLGKTSLAVTMIEDMIRAQDKAAGYVSYTSMIYDFSYRDNGDNPIRRYASVPILLIDDLGAMNEGITPHQERCLGELIEQRYSNRNRITLITTNMSVQSTSSGLGITDWIGPRSWDRIQQDLTMVDFHGDSLRGPDDDTRVPRSYQDM